MYKRTIEELKTNDPSEKADIKLASVENKIGSVDIEIEKITYEISAIKNVTTNQTAGVNRDRGMETVEELKSEAESVRLRLR